MFLNCLKKVVAAAAVLSQRLPASVRGVKKRKIQFRKEKSNQVIQWSGIFWPGKTGLAKR